MARVCLWVFMLEGAIGAKRKHVNVLRVELSASLRKLSLPFWRLLFPVATLKPAFCVFQHSFV